MLKSYTGIYQTQDELKARRVLGFLSQELSSVAFLFKGGWFEIITLDIIAEQTADQLNELSHAIANSDVKPQPLPVFRQEDSCLRISSSIPWTRRPAAVSTWLHRRTPARSAG